MQDCLCSYLHRKYTCSFFCFFFGLFWPSSHSPRSPVCSIPVGGGGGGGQCSTASVVLYPSVIGGTLISMSSKLGLVGVTQRDYGRDLWLNTIEDTPAHLRKSFISALLNAKHLFVSDKQYNNAALLKDRQNIFDYNISLFNYRSKKFHKFLRNFALEHDYTVGTRSLPRNRTDIKKWSNIPEHYWRPYGFTMKRKREDPGFGSQIETPKKKPSR